MNKVTQFFNTLFKTAETVTLSAFEHGAVVVAPICPAFFFGHAIYTAVAELATWQLAAAVGVSAAFALEAVGIRAFHNALRLGSAVSYAPPALYMAIGIGALIVIEGNSDAGVVGVAMFLLTAVLYLTIGISRQATAKVERTAERVTRQYELQVQRDEREHQLKLARIEARKEVQIARNVPNIRQNVPNDVRNVPTNGHEQKRSDWRTLSSDERKNMHHRSVADITAQYKIGERAAQKWIQRSRNLDAQVAQNGHVEGGA